MGRLRDSRVRDHVIVHLNVSSSAHNCVCVVDGGIIITLWQQLEY